MSNHPDTIKIPATTKREIQREWECIFETRLGNLCGAGIPTVEQMKIAQDEADEWRVRFEQQEIKNQGRLL